MAGRAVTQIGGLPFAAGKGVGKGVVHGGGAVASGVGHGIGSVGGFAGRRMGLIKKRSVSGKITELPERSTSDLASPDGGFNVPAGQVSQPVNGAAGDSLPTGAAATTLAPGLGSPASEPGLLNVTVMAAKDLKSEEGNGLKSYVQLRMSGKVQKTDHVRGLQPEW